MLQRLTFQPGQLGWDKERRENFCRCRSDLFKSPSLLYPPYLRCRECNKQLQLSSSAKAPQCYYRKRPSCTHNTHSPGAFSLQCSVAQTGGKRITTTDMPKKKKKNLTEKRALSGKAQKRQIGFPMNSQRVGKAAVCQRLRSQGGGGRVPCLVTENVAISAVEVHPAVASDTSSRFREECNLSRPHCASMTRW